MPLGAFLIEGEPKVVNRFRELGKVTLATSAIVAGSNKLQQKRAGCSHYNIKIN